MNTDWKNMELPNDISWDNGVENLIKHKEWIIQWNRSYYSDKSNNIDEYIERLYVSRDLFSDSMELQKIYNFRLEILNIVKKETLDNELMFENE